LCILTAQQDQREVLTLRDKPGITKIAIPDFRGSGDAQKFMGAFNETLWSDVNGSGLFNMVPKTSMPKFVPQQPSDFQSPPPPQQQNTGRKKNTDLVAPETGGGRWMKDWYGPPPQ